MAKIQVLAFRKTCNFYLLPVKSIDHGLIINQYMWLMTS